MKKIITWVDSEGRYRVTSPAYNDPTRALRGVEDPETGVLSKETEEECIQRNLAKLRLRYGLADDHPFHLVEDADQRARLAECWGTYFRYGVKGNKDALDGAWEMDVDGRPRVNMPKARGVHMDVIRLARNAELAKLDLESLRALEANNAPEQQRVAGLKRVLRDMPQTFDLTTPNDIPSELTAMWPAGLPLR